jgi:hypothetical protein
MRPRDDLVPILERVEARIAVDHLLGKQPFELRLMRVLVLHEHPLGNVVRTEVELDEQDFLLVRLREEKGVDEPHLASSPSA